MRRRKHSDWHLKVLKALPNIISNSMDTYINLRFAGYVQWDDDGEVYVTTEGYECIETGVCLMESW
jgi:hypothetical protein